MGMIETWMGVLTKPVETFATEKKNSSIMAGVKQYAIIFGIFGLLMGIEVAAMAYIMSFFPPAGNLSFIRSLGIAAIIVVPIIFIVGGIILTLIGVGIQFLIAKLLGGTGTFEQQYYLSSLTAMPALILSIIAGIISGLFGKVPILEVIITLLLILAIGLYLLYLQTKAIKEAHQFSTLKAFAVLFITPIIVGLVMGTAIMALIASMAVTKGY